MPRRARAPPGPASLSWLRAALRVRPSHKHRVAVTAEAAPGGAAAPPDGGRSLAGLLSSLLARSAPAAAPASEQERRAAAALRSAPVRAWQSELTAIVERNADHDGECARKIAQFALTPRLFDLVRRGAPLAGMLARPLEAAAPRCLLRLCLALVERASQPGVGPRLRLRQQCGAIRDLLVQADVLGAAPFPASLVAALLEAAGLLRVLATRENDGAVVQRTGAHRRSFSDLPLQDFYRPGDGDIEVEVPRRLDAARLELQSAVARAYLAADDADHAYEHLSLALGVCRELWPDSGRELPLLLDVGRLALRRGDEAAALDHFTRAAAFGVPPPSSAAAGTTDSGRFAALRALVRTSEPEPEPQRLLADDEQTSAAAECMLEASRLYLKQGNVTKALTMASRAVKTRKRLHGRRTPHAGTAAALMALGSARVQAGTPQLACKSFSDALAMSKRLHGEAPHRDVALSLLGLGEALRAAGSPTKGADSLTAAAAQLRAVGERELLVQALDQRALAVLQTSPQFKPEPPADGSVDAVAFERRSRDAALDASVCENAEIFFREADVERRDVLGDFPQPGTAQAHLGFGLAHVRRGDFARAERHLRAAIDEGARALAPDDARMCEAVRGLGRALLAQGDYSGVVDCFRGWAVLALERRGDALAAADLLGVAALSRPRAFAVVRRRVPMRTVLDRRRRRAVERPLVRSASARTLPLGPAPMARRASWAGHYHPHTLSDGTLVAGSVGLPPSQLPPMTTAQWQDWVSVSSFDSERDVCAGASVDPDPDPEPEPEPDSAATTPPNAMSRTQSWSGWEPKQRRSPAQLHSLSRAKQQYSSMHNMGSSVPSTPGGVGGGWGAQQQQQQQQMMMLMMQQMQMQMAAFQAQAQAPAAAFPTPFPTPFPFGGFMTPPGQPASPEHQHQPQPQSQQTKDHSMTSSWAGESADTLRAAEQRAADATSRAMRASHGVQLLMRKDFEGAVAWYGERLAEARAAAFGSPRGNRALAAALNNLGNALRMAGRPREALRRYEESLDIEEELHAGAAHPDVAGTLSNIGNALADLGDQRAATGYLRSAWSMRAALDPETDVSAFLSDPEALARASSKLYVKS